MQVCIANQNNQKNYFDGLNVRMNYIKINVNNKFVRITSWLFITKLFRSINLWESDFQGFLVSCIRRETIPVISLLEWKG